MSETKEITLSEFIEQKISQATSAKPITSTRLIGLVQLEFGVTISARKVRYIVKEIRNNGKPVLATRSGKQGYFWAHSIEDIDRYDAEIRNHALGELTTNSRIKASYFGKNQPELVLI